MVVKFDLCVTVARFTPQREEPSMPTSIPATQHPETRGRGRPKTGGGFVTADTLDAAIAAWNAFDGATTEYADLHKFGAFVELRQAMSRVERERDKTA